MNCFPCLLVFCAEFSKEFVTIVEENEGQSEGNAIKILATDK